METLGVRRLGYLDHARALQELADSHEALCLLDDVEGTSPRDSAAIAEALARRLRAFRDGLHSATCVPPVSRDHLARIERFHRRRLAGEFARVFAAAARQARAPQLDRWVPVGVR